MTEIVHSDGNIVHSIDISSKKEYNYEYEEVYYFIKNLQGDVIAIVDKDTQTVARYSYDARGVCSVTQDSVGIATINPFRYRSYFYDEEIKLYYLQSRYYDACVGRFVNGDESSILLFNALDFSVKNINLYVYCSNSATNFQDIFSYLGFTVYKNWEAVVMITEMIAMTVGFAISAYKLGVATAASAATGVGALIALFTGLGMAWSIALAVVNAIALVTAIVLYIKHKKFKVKSLGLFGKGIYLVCKA